MIGLRITGGDMPSAAGAVPAALAAAMTEATLLLEGEVKRRTPIGVTEAARGSIAGEVRYGAGLNGGTVVGLIGSPLPYVRVIEEGRRPGQRPPPVGALELWVRRKIKKTGPRGGRKSLSVAEARGLAFVIARAIGRRGTKPVRMFEEALQQNEPRLEAIFARAGYQIAREMSGGA